MTQREAFERWYESASMPSESDWFKIDQDEPDEYHWPTTHWAWLAWQASRAAALEESAVLVNSRRDDGDSDLRSIRDSIRALKEQS